MTQHGQCQRWAMLVDRRAAEESLSGDEQRFVIDHCAQCSSCFQENQTYDSFRRSLENDALEAAALESIELSVLRGLKQQRDQHRVRLAGATAAAAAVALFTSAALLGEPAGLPASPPASPRPLVQRTAVTAAREPAARIEATGCMRVAATIEACTAVGSELAQHTHQEPGNLTLSLRRGHVVAALEPQRPGTSFSVLTPVGTVTAVGTVFAVELAADAGSAVVRVLEGTVAVASVTGATQRISAPGAVRLSAELATVPLESADAERDWNLLGESARTRRLAAPALEPVDRTPPQRAADLLERARSQRAEGRYQEAAATYVRLRALYPKSGEAHVATLPLGELQLSQLGNANAALRSFSAYLTVGGPLAQEARDGKIRALRVLGRSVDEKREIAEFLRSHPGAVQAGALRARFSEL